MRVLAKVYFVDALVEGESDNGNHWERQTVVFETMDTEPKKLAVEFMGERKTKMTKGLEKGQEVAVDFAITCREYNLKWYTRLEGISVTPLVRENPQKDTAAPVQTAMEMASMPPAPDEPLF